MTPSSHIFSSSIAATLAIELVGLVGYFIRDNWRSNALHPLLLLNKHWHKCIVATPLLFNSISITDNISCRAISALLLLSQKVTITVLFSPCYIRNEHCARQAALIATEAGRIIVVRLSCYEADMACVVFQEFAVVEWPILQLVQLSAKSSRFGWTTWDLDMLFEWIQRASSTLSTLHVRGALGSHEPLTIIPPKFPSFDTFIHEGGQYSHDWDVFCNTPHLASLFFYDLDPAITSPLINWLSSQSHLSLTTLIIHHQLSESIQIAPHWTQLTIACPHIVDLRLSCADDKLLKLLQSNLTIWPKLTHLVLLNSPVDLGPLTALVQSRHHTHSRILKVGLRVAPWVTVQLVHLRKIVHVSMVDDFYYRYYSQ